MLIQFLQFQVLEILVNAYYLQNFVSSSISGDEGWLIKNTYNGVSIHTSSCGGTTIFGGYQRFGCYSSTQTSIIKYFRLPPHYKVRIDINFWKFNINVSLRIDDWPQNQKFYIIIDQWTQSWWFPGNIGSNQCGDNGSDYGSNEYNDFPQHTLNSIIVEMYADCDSTNFWGLTDFSVTLYECYLGCQFCLDSTVDCVNWKLWLIFFELDNLDHGLEGWMKNKFPFFTDYTNDLQLKMLVLNPQDSAITYLTLPDHNSLIIQFRVSYFSVMPIIVRVYINDEHKYGFISGKRQVDYRTSQIDDSRNFIKLEIYSQDGTIGIRELSITLRGPINLIQCVDDNFVPFDGCFAKQESCVDGCQFCVRGECLMCDIKWEYNLLNKSCEPICGDKIISSYEQCDDGNEFPFDGCHECKFSCPQYCQICLFGYCQICTSGYYQQNGNCIRDYEILLSESMGDVQKYFSQLSYYQLEVDTPVCGDGIIQQNEECDDGNNFPNDGCYNCYFQCNLDCYNCKFGVCQNCNPTFELIDQKCLDLNSQFRQLNCHNSDSHINQNLLFTQNNYFCCNISLNEVCDFGISHIQKILDLSRQICSQFCDICIFGKCQSCQANYFLFKNQCISELRGGVLLFEDGIHLNRVEIGCYKCNNSCQIQCLLCLSSFCLLCIDGWSLVDGICSQICGDQQIAQLSQEQCDSNTIDCVNCKYVCPENCILCSNSDQCSICNPSYIEINNQCELACIKNCKKCVNGICHDNCPNGEINIDGSCYSYCGDGIMQQKEECDDGNNIQFDGCHQCQYSCPQYCINCFEGICYECQQYFELIFNSCYDACGSGIISYNEQCDDANINDLDGCTSNCQIEIDYKCQEKTYSFSDCSYSESPYMIVKLVYQSYDMIYLEITFSQAIYFRDYYDQTSLFDLIIDGVNTDDYSFEIKSNYKPITNQILDYQFQIQMQLFNSTNSSLLNINIFLKNQAFNQESMEIINPQQKISFKQITLISQTDLKKTKQLRQYQEVMIMAQGFVSLMVLISGNFQIFVEILDNLQYQSYLKYINIIYPQNLYIFFDSTDLISIIPILNYLNLDDFYQKFFYQDFIESYAKLKFYNLNAHLITNMEFFFIQIIFTSLFAIMMKTICFISFKFIYKLQTQHWLIFKLRSYQSKKLIIALNQIYKFFHNIQNIVFQFYQDGLRELLLANAWDILFKTFLYLESSQMDIVSRMQTILSYMILSVSWIFITSNFKLAFSKKEYKLNYKYKAAYLLKQFFFCYFLICFQNHSMIQLLMLTTTNLIYLISLVFVEFKLEKLDKIQIIILEISIIAFTLISIFHLQDYNYLISETNKILLGFIQIYLLISGLLGIFIKQIILIYFKLKQKYLQNKKMNSTYKRATHLIFESIT